MRIMVKVILAAEQLQPSLSGIRIRYTADGGELRMPVPAGSESTIEIRVLEENGDSLPEPGMQGMEADLQENLHMLRCKVFYK